MHTGGGGGEKALTGFNSRSSDLRSFRAYCQQRRETLDACLAFYADYGHRQRRWKRTIKEQKSEPKLYERLQALRTDERPLILLPRGLIATRRRR